MQAYCHIIQEVCVSLFLYFRVAYKLLGIVKVIASLTPEISSRTPLGEISMNQKRVWPSMLAIFLAKGSAYSRAKLVMRIA